MYNIGGEKAVRKTYQNTYKYFKYITLQHVKTTHYLCEKISTKALPQKKGRGKPQPLDGNNHIFYLIIVHPINDVFERFCVD